MSTDENESWGSLGVYEYSAKGISHALTHAPELVKCGGHHEAYTTAVNETSHKDNIKRPAQLSRTYASRNESHGGMLKNVLEDITWAEVISLNNTRSTAEPSQDENKNETIEYKLLQPLPYTCSWNTLQGRLPRFWASTFFSKKVLVTREELLTILLVKMKLQLSIQKLVMIARELKWQCFASAYIKSTTGIKRKFVGVSSSSLHNTSTRRDFVRLRGTYQNTALSAQVSRCISVHFHEIMYVGALLM